MKPLSLLFFLLSAALAALPDHLQAQSVGGKEPPTDWIDPATGHRVIRLSRDGGTASLYFHQYPYTDRGDKLFVTMKGGLGTIDLTTLGVSPCKVEKIADGGAGSPTVGKKTRTVFYTRGSALYATHLDTKATRKIADLPKGYSGASGLAINADETLIASTGGDPKATEIVKARAGKVGKTESNTFPTPKDFKGAPGTKSMALFTVSVNKGEVKRVHYYPGMKDPQTPRTQRGPLLLY